VDKEEIYRSCITRATANNTLVLCEDFRYRNILVPRGYVTNGANIPRMFWSIIPPFAPRLQPAVVLHDYLCDIEIYDVADKAFATILKDLQISAWERFVLVKAVTLYHRFKYGVKPRV